MAKKYKDIYDQLLKNSRVNGSCIESIFKVQNLKKYPFMTHKGELIAVHRASWIYHNGDIPKGMYVCHHCDNRKCFNIRHLFLGSHSDNMKDMVNKKRDNIFGARKYSNNEWEKAEALRKEGYSVCQIGKKLDMRYEAIAAHMIRYKIERGEPKPKDKKFPQEIVHEILKLRKEGMEYVKIAYKLGMSISTLGRRIKQHGKIEK